MANYGDVDPQTGLNDEDRDALYEKQRLNRIRYGLDLQRRKETPPVGPYVQVKEDWAPVIKFLKMLRERPEPLEPWD